MKIDNTKRLNIPDVPPGTILGPTYSGEYMTAIGPTEDGQATRVRYTTQADMAMSGVELGLGEPPRSVTEWRLYRGLR